MTTAMHRFSAIDRCAAWVLRSTCGRRLARQALRHAHRIYGGQTKLSRRIRFMLRTLWYRETTRVWFAFLEATPWRQEQVRLEPELAEKLHRPYRRSDFLATDRLTAALSHWQALESCDWAFQAQQWRRQPCLLAEIVGKDAASCELVLCTARQFAKEGEVCLQLRSGADILFTAAFSLCLEGKTVKSLLLDVGCLQGPWGQASQQRVRDTTKLLHGMRPRDLLLRALRSIATAIGANGIVGVGSRRHVYRHWRKRRECAFNYDAYWLEQGGARRNDGDFVLPILVAPTDPAKVPSKKRAEAKRRRILQVRMCDDISAALASPIQVESRDAEMPLLS